MTAPADHLVFVYGTLRRGGSNHSFLAGQTFCHEARTTSGYQLISLGEYPGMIAIPAAGDGVAGEVWSIDDSCLARLDELEGTAEGLYRRERVILQPPLSALDVQAYLYALSPAGRIPIADGRWTGLHPKENR